MIKGIQINPVSREEIIDSQKRVVSFTMLSLTDNEEEFLCMCLNIKRPTTENMIIGSVVHSSISEKNQYHINSSTLIDHDGYVDIHEISKAKMIALTLHESTVYKQALNNGGIYEYPFYIRITLKNKISFYMKGYLDCWVPLTHSIIEFKTTRAPTLYLIQSTIKKYKYDAQLSLYCKVMEALQNISRIKAHFIFINKDKLRCFDYILTSNAIINGDKTLNRLFEQFISLVEKFELSNLFLINDK